MENNPSEPFFATRLNLSELNQAVDSIKQEISKVIVGQERTIDLMIAAILADGHILLEGVPGVAKTLTAKLFSRIISVQFSRIQFTPDLMPSDVLGTSVFNLKTSEFEFKRGPIFSNLVLIDEINRAPAKTQAALFEVMEERQVTMDGTTYLLPPPFLVIATQNPIEQEGTYRLPEAQLDRFLFKINVGYPSVEQEMDILQKASNRKSLSQLEEVNAILDSAQVLQLRELVRHIHIEPELIKYIAQIIDRTRNSPLLYLGASPRASLAIMNASKAFAAMQARDFITPEDIREMVTPVLQHRIMLTAEKEMEGITIADAINQLVSNVEVPR